MRQMIRSAALSNYVAVARSVGLDPYEMLAGVGLDRSCLVDPDVRIPASAVGRLLEASARASGAEDFGLRVAETRDLSNLGPLGLVVKEEPTLRAAIDALARYMRLHNESLFLRLEDHGPIVILSQDLSGQSASLRQSIELSIAANFRIFRSLLGADWQPLRITFTHERPANRSTYRRIFGDTPIDFLAEQNGLILRSRDLKRPLPAADPGLARYARQYLESLSLQSRDSFTGQVRQLVLTLLPAGRCSIERVAQHLSVDRRTVHRRLGAEGTSYSQLVDAVRDEIALRYLPSSPRTLSDVAELLGFAGLSAFSKWFRRRHGATATEWRARASKAETRSTAAGTRG